MSTHNKKNNGFVKIAGMVILLASLFPTVYYFLPGNIKHTFWGNAVIVLVTALLLLVVIKLIRSSINTINQKIILLNDGTAPDKIKLSRAGFFKDLAVDVNEAIDLRHGIIGETKKIRSGNFADADKLKVNYGLLGEELYGTFKGIEINAIEEEKRNWANQGQAKFAEYLRSSSEINEVSKIVLSNLVKYIIADQGMLYVLSENSGHPVLKVTSRFAAEINTAGNENIELGEGLVGQCWKSAEPIIINNAPEKYITIKSGMGASNANAIVIIPLLHDSAVQGVLEIASFNPFPEHHLAFLHKLSDSIASTLFNLRVNEKTKIFLAESQKQGDLLLQKEEVSQQQMEEMRATQEEIERVKEEMNAQLLVFDQLIAISKTDLHGNIIFVNDFMLKRTGYERHEVMGKSHRIFKSGLTPNESFKEMWETIVLGKTFRGEVINLHKDGSLLINDSIVAPLKNIRGENIEYLAIRFPIDEQKKREAEMIATRKVIENEKKKHEAILEGNVDGVISFNEAGIIQYINKAGEEIMAENRSTLLGTDIKEFIQIEIDKSGKDPEVFFIRNNEKKKIGLRTEMSFENKTGATIDILASITGTDLEDGHLFTIFAQNITVDLF